MTNSETAVWTEDQQAPSRVFLPAMALSYALLTLPSLILNVVLPDIEHTFSISKTTASQLNTGLSLVAMLTALLMGAWSLRYPYRSLLLMGLLVTSLAAAGSFLALNFPMLLLFFALFGWGGGMVYSMTFALIGAHFPPAQQARALGRFITRFTLVAILAVLVSGFIVGASGEGGWRWPFLGVLLPLTLLSLVLTLKGVPALAQSRPRQNVETYWAGFQEIFTNRSATVCLGGVVLLTAGWQTIFIYYSSFLRERFSVSVEVATILLMVGGGLLFAVGSHIGGRIVPRFGRKRVTVVTAFLMGLFISIYMLPPTPWLAVGFSYLVTIFSGMRMTAVSSLILEQVPHFRGSMMSLNSAAIFLGGALGAGVGGLALLLGDYEGLGLTLGALCFVAALLYYRLVVDPTSEPQRGG